MIKRILKHVVLSKVLQFYNIYFAFLIIIFIVYAFFQKKTKNL